MARRWVPQRDRRTSALHTSASPSTTRTGTGSGPIVVFSAVLSSGVYAATELPSLITLARPRAATSMPSVAISGQTPNARARTPFVSPASSPTPSAASTPACHEPEAV